MTKIYPRNGNTPILDFTDLLVHSINANTFKTKVSAVNTTIGDDKHVIRLEDLNIGSKTIGGASATGTFTIPLNF